MNQNETKVAEMLSKLDEYGMLDDFAESIKKVTTSVMETGLVGKVNMDLSFKRNGHNEVIVMPKLTEKIPRKPMTATPFFVDKDNNFHEENPDQMKTYDNVSSIDQKKKVNEV